MDAIIKAWKTSRNLYLEFFDKYSLEQLNSVPDKFNNNLIWNIGTSLRRSSHWCTERRTFP